MPAPDKYPDWATDNTHNVEPPAGKKAAGWVALEEPPSGWFNWWQWYVGLWVRWLDSAVVALTGRMTTAEGNISAIDTDLTTLEGDAALKSLVNTFTQGQVINVEDASPDWPLITTTQKVTDWATNPANRWKLVLEVPTQGNAKAGIYVGQSPYGAALVNNARWHLPTQRWRQYDDGYVSTAMVGRSGQFVVSHVPAGAAPWLDWPIDTGGDVLAGGNIQSHGDLIAIGNFNHSGSHAHNNLPIKLASGSGALVLNTDGTYSVTSGWGAWPVRIPPGVTLSNIECWLFQSSASLLQVALVRRGLGSGSSMPTYTDVTAENTTGGAGFKFVTIFCGGHMLDPDYEYSVVFRPAVAGDKIGRIAVISWEDPGPRNLG